MTVRKKTIVIIGLTIGCLIIALYAVSRINILNSFTALEEQDTRRNVERAVSAVQDDLVILNRTAHDWAAWDDTYDFVMDANDDYVKTNLVSDAFETLNLDVMIILNRSGRVVYGQGYDRAEGNIIPLPESLRGHIMPDSPLVKHLSPDSYLRGIVSLPEGPMLVASRPVLTSENQGPVRGSLIMGRYLAAREVGNLAQKTHLSFRTYSLKHAAAQFPPGVREKLTSSAQDIPVEVQTTGENFVSGYALVRDIYGEPAVILAVDIPRDIYRQGRAALFYLLLSLLVVGLVSGTVTLLLLEKAVLSRITRLGRNVAGIGAEKDFSSRLDITGNDEITSLTGAINDMLEALDQEKERLAVTLSSIGDAVIAVDAAGVITIFNPVAETLTGWKAQEITGKTFDEILKTINADEYIPVGISLNKVLAGEDINSSPGLNCVLIARDGTKRFVKESAAPICDTSGKVLGAVIVFRDVTAEIKNEARLKENEARFRLLAENARDIIYRLKTKPKPHFDYISPAVTHITGYPPEEYYAKPYIIRRNIHPNDLVTLQNIVNGKGDFSKTVTMKWKRKDEKFIWLELHNAPVYDENGELVAIEGIVRDVTDRKRIEGKLKYMSMHDSLTGLYNRACFEQEMARHKDARPGDSLGIIVCDVDGLKLFNDTLGHDAGDRLLVAAARVIKDSFRQDDFVARVGGDEFAVILPNSQDYIVQEACSRIKNAVEKYNLKNPGMPLSISLGYAMRSDSLVGLREVFKEADNNMYREKLHRKQSARSAIVQTLMKALEARDFITEGHAKRLQTLVVGMARSLGLPETKITDLRLFAQFHDIGKVGIPDHILFKPGPLTPEEVTEMQRHSEIGHRIALSAPDLAPIADWVLKHHEWWNGKGYPLGLKGEEIPLECRILAIADAYDAMTSERPYRKAIPHGEAMWNLKKYSNVQFDPRLVPKFIEILENRALVGW